MTVEKIEQNQKEVKRTERGWAGHFICSSSCYFRRNTLLECGDIKIVVSTIGNYRNEQGQQDEVGLDRDYETMAFHVDPKTGDYKDIDLGKEIFFESPCAFKVQKDDKYIDLKANDMHETVVLFFNNSLDYTTIHLYSSTQKRRAEPAKERNMENKILSYLGQRDGYCMVMEAGSNGRTYYALYIGVALLDCYPVDDDEAEEWVQRKMRDYKIA